MLTNDLTEDVLEECVEKKADLIVSYHPPIFRPLKRLTQENWKVGPKLSYVRMHAGPFDLVMTPTIGATLQKKNGADISFVGCRDPNIFRQNIQESVLKYVLGREGKIRRISRFCQNIIAFLQQLHASKCRGNSIPPIPTILKVMSLGLVIGKHIRTHVTFSHELNA